MDPQALDVAIVGAGIGGLAHLHYARRAGLRARAFDAQDGVGGLWRRLPAWQDIQISAADWALVDLPLAGTAQPHILANLEAWADRLQLREDLAFRCPVRARHDGAQWLLDTPHGQWRARHLVAAAGGHSRPVVPQVQRREAQLRELHSSELRDLGELAGRSVLVVGGGASAFDLIDLALEHRAAKVHWAYRGVRWFLPTGKPKSLAGSVRPYAKMQAAGLTHEQQNEAIGGDMVSRYAKFGLREIQPSRPWEVREDQLIPGRARMLANFRELDRHAATVEAIEGGEVTLTDGARLRPDVLLWGTGYAPDLRWIEHPALAAVGHVNELAARCGGMVRSRDLPNLYLPGVFLDGIGSSTWAYSLIARSVASHIRGTARWDMDPLPHKINHFDLVTYLAARDPASYPGDWRARYRALALETPDDQPYPLPD